MTSAHLTKGSIISLFAVATFAIAFAFAAPIVARADASCSTVGGSLLVDFTQNISNDPDSSVSGPNWALDNFTRHIQIWQEAGAPTGEYCAKADDSGSFTSNGGMTGINPGTSPASALPEVVVGSFTGGTYGKITGGTFSTTTNPVDVDCSATPTTCSDGLTHYWLNNYFGSGATYAYDNNWGWTYASADNGTWVNAAAGNSDDIVHSSTVTVYTEAQLTTELADSSVSTIKFGNDITTTAEVTVSRSVTIDGQTYTLKPTFTKTSSSNNAAIGITASNVTIQNLKINGASGTSLHGINTYLAYNVVLNNVTVSNNGNGAAMIVNGSTVSATNLTTSGNSWGSVNVDPGSGVSTSSVFTLNSGSLGDSTQIWSDGGHVTSGATVTVNASGYTQYKRAGFSAFFIWANQPVTNAATISSGGVNTLYSSIQAAITAASSTAVDTIVVGSGNYSENLTINKAVNLVGPNSTVNPNTGTRGTEAAITGQLSVYAGNVSIKGLKFTNPSWSGATIKGIHVYSNGPVISNIDIENNIFDGIANAQVHGSYGVMVQGEIDGAIVSNNLFENISSQGWTHALEVTPTGSNSVVPQNVTIQNNVFTNITNASGADQYAFSVDSGTGVYAKASEISFSGNSLVGTSIRNLDASSTLNASSNYWGTGTASPSAQVGGDVAYSPWYTDAAMTALGFTTASSGGQASTTISNAETLTGSGSGSVTVTAELPANTVVTGDSSWDGSLTAPTATTKTVTVSGFDTTVSSAIAVGSSQSDITFSKAVKLTFAGQAGKLIGWYNHAGTFTEITMVCAGNDQATADMTLADGGSCKVDAGSDLVVWTKHFSTFVSYTQTAIPAPVSGGGGGGGGGGGSIVGLVSGSTGPVATALPNNGGVAATTGTVATTGSVGGSTGGQVLGASTFNFTSDLRVGSHGADVTELQKVLIAEGDISITAPTGYFGGVTKAGVVKYQKAHGISPQSGFVGPLTRVELNKGTTPTMSDEQRSTLIASLTAQLNALTAQLKALQGK